jgi:hypothetical protein
MKYLKKYILLVAFIPLLFACKRDKPATAPSTPSYAVTVYQPQKVAITNSLPTYVHYMPWFGSKEFSGSWHHWGNNADNIKANGQKDIPTVYYPLIDLYDNKDSSYLEYAFLCMKLCGVEGVFIDYYSELKLNDYAFNFERTIAAMDMADKVGLNYAVVYEDALLIAAAGSSVSGQANTLTNNINYLKTNIFNRPNYVKVGGKPLLMIFGPSSSLTGTDWRSIIHQDMAFVGVTWKPQTPSFKPYLDGVMSWTGASSAAAAELNQCMIDYNVCIAGAMPGFETVNAGDPHTDPRNGDNFREGLQNAKAKNPSFLQIPTWNDWQEGTTIEPSVEYGYSRLEILQAFMGVSYTKADLELTVQLYQKRKKFKGKTYENQVLDQVFYYLVSLQMDQARQLLNTI